MDEYIKIDTLIPIAMAGKRLDQVLVSVLPQHSRTRLQSWVRDDYIKVDNKPMSPSARIKGGEQLKICVTLKKQLDIVAEDIPLQIVFEDDELLVINKPAGLVVHPGAGNQRHTLMQALLNYDDQLSQIPRAGIVHRLDKDTTGLLVVARTLHSHTDIVKQLQARTIQRQYIALVTGLVVAGGTIDQAIGRDKKHRTKMAVTEQGRSARTHYRVAKKYKHHTQLKVTLETGRTHQIRVHMTWLKHPIVGDAMYGHNRQLLKGMSESMVKTIQAFPRQALHAHTLSLLHPKSKQTVQWQAPIPQDMCTLITALEQDSQQS